VVKSPTRRGEQEGLGGWQSRSLSDGPFHRAVMATPQKGAAAAAAPGIRSPATAVRGAAATATADRKAAPPLVKPGQPEVWPAAGFAAKPPAKPKKDAKPKVPVGKRMKDGYWAGGQKMFKPNGNGRCDAKPSTLNPQP
jgi:hypothetical protein